MIGGDGSRRPQLKDLVSLEVPPNMLYILGLQLDISAYHLDEIIVNKQGDFQACKMEMFKKWLNCTDSASYTNLLKALNRIGEQSLAAKVLAGRQANVELNPSLAVMDLTFNPLVVIS